jgi:hypothetical protein
LPDVEKPAERRRNKQAAEAAQIAYDADPKNKNGWLWELRKPSNMSEKEMQTWEEEGTSYLRLFSHWR